MAIQKLSGVDVNIKANDKEVGCADTISLTLNTAFDSSTCRADGGWDSGVPGRHSWTASIDGAWRIATAGDAAGESTMKDFMALQIARTPVTIDFGTNISGDTRYTGTAYITSTNPNAPGDGPATFSVELTGSGPLVPSVNA